MDSEKTTQQPVAEPVEAAGEPRTEPSAPAEQTAPVAAPAEAQPADVAEASDEPKQDDHTKKEELPKPVKPAEPAQPSTLPIGFIVTGLLVLALLAGLAYMAYSNQ